MFYLFLSVFPNLLTPLSLLFHTFMRVIFGSLLVLGCFNTSAIINDIEARFNFCLMGKKKLCERDFCE